MIVSSYEARDALDIRSRSPPLRISVEGLRLSEFSLATDGYIAKKIDSREVVTRQEPECSHMLGSRPLLNIILLARLLLMDLFQILGQPMPSMALLKQIPIDGLGRGRPFSCWRARRAADSPASPPPMMMTSRTPHTHTSELCVDLNTGGRSIAGDCQLGHRFRPPVFRWN